jgi:hypothetical protein
MSRGILLTRQIFASLCGTVTAIQNLDGALGRENNKVVNRDGNNKSTRRVFCRSMLLTSSWALLDQGMAMSPAPGINTGKPKIRPDLLDKNSLKTLEVAQLTTEPDVPASHLYMEAQIFTADSKRFLLHRSATAHGSDKEDPKHQYLVCDIENDCALHPLTHETGATAPSVTPDGQLVYYFVDETEPGHGRLTLKRVGLDGTDRQTVMVLDSPLPNTRFRPSRIYPLSTISSDGQRLALSCFLGDGKAENAPWGLMIFDLRKATVSVVLQGSTWCNVHPQYCRSKEPEESRDILVQENHGCVYDAVGKVQKLISGEGADIHVIRDDGAKLRDMPWGRDGNEFCQGHQCWRGRSTWAITSTVRSRPAQAQLIESRALPHSGHLGLKSSAGVRNDLSREFSNPKFYHFATDIAGRRLITDAAPFNEGGRVFMAEFGKAGTDALQRWTYLLNPKSSGAKTAHIHPFLSPDGRLAFFNSDESGILQAYMIRGLP